MTVAVLDRNEAFLAERQTQIRTAIQAREDAVARNSERAASFDKRMESGKLTALGGGRFRVTDTDSWDNGEVLTLRQTPMGRLILPEHNLDMTTGQAALYSAVPTWHEAGNVIPGGTTDIEQVLRLGGIDFTVGITRSLFRDHTGALRESKKSWTTYREDTGDELGTVGNVYTPFQNREAFAFLQDLAGKEGITWESAGALYSGTRVFISFRMPGELRVDPGGINDEILPFIVFLNSHDGSTKVVTCVSPWRPVCGNTERFALRDATARWGHVHNKNVASRVQEAQRELNLANAYYGKYVSEMEMLARTDLAIDEFIAVMKDIYEPCDEDADNATRNRHARRAASLITRFENNANVLGHTAYAAERAFTEYMDSRIVKPRGELRGDMVAARATRLLDGDDDPKKTAVHKRLLTLVRR